MINSTIKDRAVLFLEQKLSAFNINLKAKFDEGNVIFRDAKLYANKAVLVGTGGNIEVVNSLLPIEPGKTSFDKGKTEPLSAVAVTGIIGRYGGAAANADLTNKPYSEYVYDMAGVQRIPSEILNAQLQIIIGNVMVYDGSARNIFSMGRENSSGTANFMELKAPKFIDGEQDVKINLRLADGTLLLGTAGQNHFIQVELDGVSTAITK